jgi:phosphoribosylformylglycinamidine synthase PurS subunit
MGEQGTTVEIRVELKRGILDAEADSIEKSLHLLGLSGLTEVHTARIFSLTFRGVSEPEARERAQRAVDQLLANPVIHHVEFSARPS